ncbi:MAG: hypothetical protein H7Y27_10590 [Gemmatimonadaceae bacterium]|nr:hypothetical protein [Chitinophagaceae bacterium]
MFKTNKIVLGIITLLPLLFLSLYLLTVAGLFTDAVNVHRPENGPPGFMVNNFLSSVMIMGCFFLSTIGLLIYFLFHLASNPIINNDERFFWALFFLFAGILSFPLYWYFRIHLNPKNQ